MELPVQLKSLYRHWDYHLPRQGVRLEPNPEIPDNLKWFVKERIAIWENKSSGKKPPYTRDKILSRYRFCNIFREFDRQTIEFHTILNPLRDNFSLWLLNMFYCRMVARLETIQSLGLLSFSEKENQRLQRRFIVSSRPRFGVPYVFPISVIQGSKTPTRELFITEYLPRVMRDVAQEIQTWQREPVYLGTSKVVKIFKFNLSFLWTEVIIDVAYQFPEWVDLFKRFPVGPGSLPTFKTLSPTGDSSVLVERLAAAQIATDITYKGTPLILSAENWEGIGCEFRKYTNLKQGKGRKRLYRS